MAKAVKIKFKALYKSGEHIVEAWAPHSRSEIVTHRSIRFGGEVFSDFVLSHRRSGYSIRGWKYRYARKIDALRAIEKIMRFTEWKAFGRPKKMGGKIPGWSGKLAKTLSAKLDAAFGEVHGSDSDFQKTSARQRRSSFEIC